MSDLVDALDGLQADMAAHQRAHVGEVTASSNQKLAAEAIARIDREAAEAKPAAEANHAQPVVQSGATVKEGKHGRYLLTTSPSDDVKFRGSTPAEHWFMTHAMPRVDLLRTKQDTGPLGQASWRQRVDAVMQLMADVPGFIQRGLHATAEDRRKRFMFELIELLEASVPMFGDWKADAVKNPMLGWTPARGA